MFHHEGLVAICVSNAALAMTIAPYADVIITGLRLSGEINGVELIAWLKRDERTKNIPIVVLTACAWRTEWERAETAGCDVFFVEAVPAVRTAAGTSTIAGVREVATHSAQCRWEAVRVRGDGPRTLFARWEEGTVAARTDRGCVDARPRN